MSRYGNGSAMTHLETPTATKPARALTTLQQQAVQRRAVDIGRSLVSGQLTRIEDLREALRTASVEVNLSEVVIESALVDHAKGFSIEARRKIPEEIGERLGIQVPPTDE